MRSVLPLLAALLVLPSCSQSESAPASPGAEGGTAEDAQSDDVPDASPPKPDGASTPDTGPNEASAGDGGAEAEASTPKAQWDWNGVIGTGQSLSVGAQSTPTLKTQAFHNLKLSLGSLNLTVPPYDDTNAALSVVPLTEPIRPLAAGYPGAYPGNIYGETPHTAMSDQISELYQKDTGSDYVTVHTVVGESGQGIDVIDKGATVTSNMGHAYAATLFEVKALARLAAGAGKTYGVAAIVVTHGETDGGNANYETQLYQLYSDYNDDIAAVTGQTTKIPMLLTQQQTSPGDNSTTASLIAEWKIGLDHPGEVVCVGPKYQYVYASDNLHLMEKGYEQLGEKYAEVYYERVVLGHDWQPLQPASVSRSGKIITVHFHVPVAPLAWDDAMPKPHQGAHTAWASGRGFEVQNKSGEQTIQSVAIDGDAVAITLASDPSTDGLVVRYAVTQDGTGSQGHLATGRIGQLRDSDPLVGYYTQSPQYNYAVSFTMPVN